MGFAYNVGVTRACGDHFNLSTCFCTRRTMSYEPMTVVTEADVAFNIEARIHRERLKAVAHDAYLQRKAGEVARKLLCALRTDRFQARLEHAWEQPVLTVTVKHRVKDVDGPSIQSPIILGRWLPVGGFLNTVERQLSAMLCDNGHEVYSRDLRWTLLVPDPCSWAMCFPCTRHVITVGLEVRPLQDFALATPAPCASASRGT